MGSIVSLSGRQCSQPQEEGVIKMSNMKIVMLDSKTVGFVIVGQAIEGELVTVLSHGLDGVRIVETGIVESVL